MCVSNAPCIGGLELSYQGSCWPWGSEEPCQSPEVLISDIYGNVSCACKCVDIEDGSCLRDEECDDVPRCVLCNDEPEPDPEIVPIPSVSYHQKYVRKILCSSDHLFCD